MLDMREKEGVSRTIREEEESFDEIELDQMSQVIAMPFIGILLGIIIMIIEISVKKLLQRKGKVRKMEMSFMVVGKDI